MLMKADSFHKQPKHIAERGARELHERASGDKADNDSGMCQCCLFYAASSGNLQRRALKMPNTPKIKFQTHSMESKQGWINRGLFYLWFSELFCKNIPPNRPILLQTLHTIHLKLYEKHKKRE